MVSVCPVHQRFQRVILQQTRLVFLISGLRYHILNYGVTSVKLITFRCSLFVFVGEIIECRTSNPFGSPYLFSVRPLAVVAGQQNRLIVNGLNLTKR